MCYFSTLYIYLYLFLARLAIDCQKINKKSICWLSGHTEFNTYTTHSLSSMYKMWLVRCRHFFIAWKMLSSEKFKKYISCSFSVNTSEECVTPRRQAITHIHFQSSVFWKFKQPLLIKLMCPYTSNIVKMCCVCFCQYKNNLNLIYFKF